MSFQDWLISELQNRGWSQAELARRANVSRAAISNVLSSNRNPGPELCEAIALAMHIQPEEVFRQAGLLPPSKKNSAQEERAKYLFESLHESESKARAINYLEFLHQQEEKAGKGVSSTANDEVPKPG